MLFTSPENAEISSWEGINAGLLASPPHEADLAAGDFDFCLQRVVRHDLHHRFGSLGSVALAAG